MNSKQRTIAKTNISMPLSPKNTINKPKTYVTKPLSSQNQPNKKQYDENQCPVEHISRLKKRNSITQKIYQAETRKFQNSSQHTKSGYLYSPTTQDVLKPKNKYSQTGMKFQKNNNNSEISYPNLFSQKMCLSPVVSKAVSIRSTIDQENKKFYTYTPNNQKSNRETQAMMNICQPLKLNKNMTMKADKNDEFQTDQVKLQYKLSSQYSPTNYKARQNNKLFFTNREMCSNKKNTHTLTSNSKEIKSPSFLRKKTNRPMTKDNFLLLKTLATSKYGTVGIFIHLNTGFICVIKSIHKQIVKEEDRINPLIEEIKIQTYLDHPNIVKLYGYFSDESTIYLIIEYCPHGTLEELIKKQHMTENQNKSLKNGENHQSWGLTKNLISEEENILQIFIDIFQSIDFMHSQGVLHRDLKPENIVISFGVHKICDFGWSVYASGETRRTFCGTPLYISPELVIGKQYDEKIDIWGLGITFYQLIYGKVPFTMFQATDMKKIVKQQIEYTKTVKFSVQLVELIKKMLEKDTEKRYDISKIMKETIINQRLTARRKQYDI